VVIKARRNNVIRDRGNIKWTAMMLSEHVAELRRWKDEEQYEERPELNEWDLQAIQEELEVAYKRKCQALVKTWKDGKVISRGGIIEEIDLKSECVLLDDPIRIERIPFADIIGVQSKD
jgi:hypothetical protein